MSYQTKDMCPQCHLDNLCENEMHHYLYCPRCRWSTQKPIVDTDVSSPPSPPPQKVEVEIPSYVGKSFNVSVDDEGRMVLTEIDENERQSFSTGAVRGTGAIPYHLIPANAIMSVGCTYAEGAAKYSKYNNLNGFPLSNLFDHAMDHLLRFWWAMDSSEEDISHALFNLQQIELQLSNPEKYDHLDDRPEHEVLTTSIADAFKRVATEYMKKYEEKQKQASSKSC